MNFSLQVGRPMRPCVVESNGETHTTHLVNQMLPRAYANKEFFHKKEIDYNFSIRFCLFFRFVNTTKYQFVTCLMHIETNHCLVLLMNIASDVYSCQVARKKPCWIRR